MVGLTVTTEFVSDLGDFHFCLKQLDPKIKIVWAFSNCASWRRGHRLQFREVDQTDIQIVHGGFNDSWRCYGRHDDECNGWPNHSFGYHCLWVYLQEKFPSLDDLLSKRHRAPANGAIPPAVQTDVAHRCRWRQPSGLVMSLSTVMSDIVGRDLLAPLLSRKLKYANMPVVDSASTVRRSLRLFSRCDRDLLIKPVWS